MKRFLTLLTLLFLFNNIYALDASITYATFKSPQQKYVELSIYVVGKTVTYVPTVADTTIAQAGVEVVILFKQNGEIVKFDKYQLNGPMSSEAEDFVDLKRYALEDGNYDLEVSIQDLKNAGNAIQYKGAFQIDYPNEKTKLLQSDIQLLASIKASIEDHVLVKNGYMIEPLPNNFYHKNSSQLILYNEIYETDTKINAPFQVTYGIEKVTNGKTSSIIIGHKKRQPKPINVLILKMDIADLPSGNYNLFVEVRNRAKELLSRKNIEFQRSNPYLQVSHFETEQLNIDDEFVIELSNQELRYSLKAIAPLVQDIDVELLNSVINNKDSTVQQRFLFNFWVNQNPNQPQMSYKAYMKVAKAVDKMYPSGLGYGFESDRGYMFLRYGRPDDMVKVENDPSAPPYEIWVYNDFPMTHQTNVRFLFYAPALGTDFRLLHSTARGEMNNPQWQLELYKGVPDEIEGSNYIDATNMQDNWNRRASQYFNEN